MEHPSTTPQHPAAVTYPRCTPRATCYALEDPTTPGLYFAVDGEQARPAPLSEATLAPHTPAGLAWLKGEAARRLGGVPHEVVRLEACS